MRTVLAATLIQMVSLSPDPPRYLRAMIYLRQQRLLSHRYTAQSPFRRRYTHDHNHDQRTMSTCRKTHRYLPTAPRTLPRRSPNLLYTLQNHTSGNRIPHPIPSALITLKPLPIPRALFFPRPQTRDPSLELPTPRGPLGRALDSYPGAKADPLAARLRK